MKKRKTWPATILILCLVGLSACGGGGGDGALDSGNDEFQEQISEDAEPDAVIFPDLRQPDGGCDNGCFEVLEVEDLGDPPDVNPACEEMPYVDGCPCHVDADCQGNFCTLHLGELLCSRSCTEDCPMGWTCDQLYDSYPDVMYVCVSLHPSECLPCQHDSDCSGKADRCVTYEGDVGSFCASQCDSQSQFAECPDGWTCGPGTSLSGESSNYCIRDGGDCPCTGWAVEQGRSTVCERTNGFGSCVGQRTCIEKGLNGLSDCPALEPSAEQCFNEVDDDCDGIIDNSTLCAGCECSDGVCDEVSCGEGWGIDLRNCAVDCAVCGDGDCAPGEGPVACPSDCCGSCGDGACQTLCGESHSDCPQDCTGVCGDLECDATENRVECPQDCPASCGNHTCEPGETTLCPLDCPSGCGDCICSMDEDYASCPQDCGFCGDGLCYVTCSAMYTPENLASCPEDCCVPDCAGRECGSDGCQGSCGICSPNHICTEDGQCTCVPFCSGKVCGDDSCGGSCGTCGAGTLCVQGACMPGCVTDLGCTEDQECVAGYCRPDLPDDVRLASGDLVRYLGQAATVQARVFEEDLTGISGAAAGLSVQVGIGPTGFDPTVSPQSFTWTTASYSGEDSGWDLWSGTLPVNVAGSFLYGFRASLDGLHWAYGDATGLSDGYDVADIGHLTVKPLPVIQSMEPAFASVSGGDSIVLKGSGLSGAGVSLGGLLLTPTYQDATQVVFTAPAHGAGDVVVSLAIAGIAAVSPPTPLTYVLRRTVQVDGDLSDWTDAYRVGTNSLTSNWDASVNHLEELFVAFDHQNLYIGVSGHSEDQNYILVYIDGDLGEASGAADMEWLSDNTGNGDLDDAVSNILNVTVEGFGAELACGTRGLATFGQGWDLSASVYVGWRKLGPPYNLPWLGGWLVSGTGGFEAAIPLTALYEEGIPSKSTLGVFAHLSNRYGDTGGISNQNLPETYDAGTPENVGAVGSTPFRW